MKTIFITGASSGLGKATAKLFAAKDWNVIATMRDPDKETELNKIKNVVLLPLDVSNVDEIAEITAKALSLFDVDVVFNNAGFIMIGPLEGTTDDQLSGLINTDLLGVIRITKAFIPHFRERKSGLFLTTTSFAAIIPDPFAAVYRAAKAGLEGWSQAMTFELNKFGIGIKTIVPGFMKTGIASSAVIASHEAYKDLVNKVVSKFSNPEASQSASTPEQIAEVVYEAATDRKDHTRYLAGTDAHQRFSELEKNGNEAIRNAVDQLFFG